MGNKGKIAMHNGNKISKILHLKKSGKGIAGKNQILIHNLIHQALINPERPIRHDLERVYRQIHQNHRDKDMILGILEILWQVPKNSKLERILFFKLKDYILNIQHSKKQMHIVNEKLWGAQKSGFAVVRRIAIELKSISPVDEVELEELVNKRLSYPDVQLSIVQRLIDHRQVNHIEHILNYFLFLSMDRQNKRANEHLGGLIRRIQTWPPEQLYLKAVYEFYIAQAANDKIRGWIMHLLTHYGQGFVMVLKQTYDQEIDSIRKRHIVNLFAHMTSFGKVGALKFLVEIYQANDGYSNQFVLSSIQRSLQKAYTRKDLLSPEFWAVVKNTHANLLDKLEPHSVALLEVISQAEEKAVLEEEDVLSLLIELDKNQLKKMEWRFRSASSQVFTEILRIAKTDDYSISVRKKALQIAKVFNSIPIEFKINAYWNAFILCQNEELQIDILHILAGIHVQSNEIRQELYKYSDSATPSVQKVIKELWTKIFAEVKPTFQEGER